MVGRSHWLTAARLALCVMAPVSAHAAEPASPQVADQTVRDLRASVSALLGPTAHLPPQFATMQPTDDHYRLTIRPGGERDTLGFGADASRDADGRWTLENLGLLDPSVIAFGSGRSGPALRVWAARQSGGAAFDPALTTPSTADTAMSGFNALLSTTIDYGLLHAESLETHWRMQPIDGEHVDASVEFGLAGVRAGARRFERSDWQGLLAARLRFGIAVSGLVRSRAQDAISTGATLVNTSAPQQQDEVGRRFVAAVLNAASGLSLTIAADAADAMAPTEIGLRRASLALALDGVGGRLRADAVLEAEGPFVPELFAHKLADLAPERVGLHARVAGPASDVARRLLAAFVTDRQFAPSDIDALFANPLTVDVDRVAVLVAGARLSATGSGRMAGPGSIQAEAHITAADLDRLQVVLGSTPDLRQAGAALIFLKGLARTEGDHLAWDVTFRDGTWLVNGQDVVALSQRMQGR